MGSFIHRLLSPGFTSAPSLVWLDSLAKPLPHSARSRSCLSFLIAAGTLACLAFSGSARATEVDQGSAGGRAASSAGGAASQHDAPVVMLTHSARGASAGRYGASAIGSSTLGLSGDVRDESQFGGGLRLWGAPIDRLTLLAEGSRRDNGEMAPALTLQVRILENQAWAFGALGRYKGEGFAEVEGEVEAGLLGAYAGSGLHLDLNVVAGRGFEEEETDGELLFRGGYEVLGTLQVGVEGRARYRLAGNRDLPGEKSWDAIGGPQVTASVGQLFAGALTGPTTVGVVDGVGWGSLLTFGGVM